MRMPRDKRVWRPELPLWAAGAMSLPMLVAFVFLVFYPAVQLVLTSLPHGSTAAYRALFHGGPELRALKTTMWDSAVVAGITLLLGAVVAWTLRTTRSRVVSAMFWLGVMLPMSMSVVVKNFTWIVILGRFGALNWLLRTLHLPTHSFLFTTTAVTIGMVYTLFPFAVFPLYVTFTSIPDHLIAAAETLGGRWWQTMRTVVIPLSIPGLFITTVLLFVLSIGFYVTPIVLGGPSSTFLSVLIQGDLLLRFDQVSASATSVLLMVVAVLLVTIAIKLVGRERFERALG
jgi:ABC-type spermidine/putrescine transport system permease subunit I